jgi:hypothetical protein
VLLIDESLRVTNNVYEENMRDLKLNFLFDLGGHADSRRNGSARYSPPDGGPSRVKLALSNILRSDP